MFSIRDEFVTEAMEGRFDGTVIVMMGCSCLRLDDLARAFVSRGASSYPGRHATVELGYVDRATPQLLQQLCRDGVTIKSAVDATMAAVGPDPTYGARLKYYPVERGGLCCLFCHALTPLATTGPVTLAVWRACYGFVS